MKYSIVFVGSDRLPIVTNIALGSHLAALTHLRNHAKFQADNGRRGRFALFLLDENTTARKELIGKESAPWDLPHHECPDPESWTDFAAHQVKTTRYTVELQGTRSKEWTEAAVFNQFSHAIDHIDDCVANWPGHPSYRIVQALSNGLNEIMYERLQPKINAVVDLDEVQARADLQSAAEQALARLRLDP